MSYKHCSRVQLPNARQMMGSRQAAKSRVSESLIRGFESHLPYSYANVAKRQRRLTQTQFFVGSTPTVRTIGVSSKGKILVSNSKDGGSSPSAPVCLRLAGANVGFLNR